MDRIEEKAFARSIAAYHISGIVLTYSSNENTSIKTPAIGITTWLNLALICHSPRSICLLHRPNRHVECSGITILASFQVLVAAAAAKSLQLCSPLCNPIDSSPPGSPIPGILQARVLEWGAIAFSIKSLMVTLTSAIPQESNTAFGLLFS